MMMMMMVCGCREDQDRVAQKWMDEQTKYEDAHLGNFRRIYPSDDSEKYDRFFHSSGSLYQETASFKARSECARLVLLVNRVEQLSELPLVVQKKYKHFCRCNNSQTEKQWLVIKNVIMLRP